MDGPNGMHIENIIIYGDQRHTRKKHWQLKLGDNFDGAAVAAAAAASKNKCNHRRNKNDILLYYWYGWCWWCLCWHSVIVALRKQQNNNQRYVSISNQRQYETHTHIRTDAIRFLSLPFYCYDVLHNAYVLWLNGHNRTAAVCVCVCVCQLCASASFPATMKFAWNYFGWFIKWKPSAHTIREAAPQSLIKC